MIERLARESWYQLGKLATDLPILKIFAGIVTACIHYLLPIDELRNTAIALFTLILADTATGVWAAIKLGSKISSRRLSDILGKIVAYGAVVMVLAIVPRSIPSMSDAGVAISVGIGLGILILAESVSILENVSLMGYKLFGFTNLFKARLTKTAKDLIKTHLDEMSTKEAAITQQGNT